MIKKIPSRITVCDIILIALIAACAAVMLVSMSGMAKGNTVRITTDSETVTYPLTEDRTVPVESNGYTLTVVIENGEVFVTDADCPDKTCEKTGHISQAGRSLICAPAHVIVTVTGEKEADYAIR